MRWQGRTGSSNVQDRRGMSGGMMGGGAGLIIAIIAALFFGGDPGAILNQAPVAQEQAGPTTPEQQQAGEFVSVVLADTEATWNRLLAERGIDYPEPTLVLFSGAVQSACGQASSAVGPFYCPNDQDVYLDTSFFEELSRRFGAPGDFAQAYVIAHEVGHHVQNVIGVFEQTGQQRSNETQVRIELQADCFAGVWGHHAQSQQDFIEWGDIEEGLGAASAIGDDRLQQQTQGHVVPESFTHGTSEQRTAWFKRGLESGRAESCDTFSGGI